MANIPSQFSPVHPVVQTQSYDPSTSLHVPPFWQGFGLHMLSEIKQQIPSNNFADFLALKQTYGLKHEKPTPQF